MATAGWFALETPVPTLDGGERDVWRPCLDTGTGIVGELDFDFDDRHSCEQWIRDFILGAGMWGEG